MSCWWWRGCWWPASWVCGLPISPRLNSISLLLCLVLIFLLAFLSGLCFPFLLNDFLLVAPFPVIQLFEHCLQPLLLLCIKHHLQFFALDALNAQSGPRPDVLSAVLLFDALFRLFVSREANKDDPKSSSRLFVDLRFERHNATMQTKVSTNLIIGCQW